MFNHTLLACGLNTGAAEQPRRASSACPEGGKPTCRVPVQLAGCYLSDPSDTVLHSPPRIPVAGEPTLTASPEQLLAVRFI